MNKLHQLYEGKAKKLYATDDTDVLWVEYMNQATAGNGAKKELIEGKASLNNHITSVLFDLLAARGIPSHFITRLSNTEQLVHAMSMYPLEIIMRNTAAGSFAQRYGIEEGQPLSKPILEFCLKSDALGDPFIANDAIVALGFASEDELAQICDLAHRVNNALCEIFSSIEVQLVDFKIEIGKNSNGEIVLADEITPDTCRLWNKQVSSGTSDGTHHVEHLDKDLFRRDLGDIIPAYQEIYSRLLHLAHSEHVSLREQA